MHTVQRREGDAIEREKSRRNAVLDGQAWEMTFWPQRQSRVSPGPSGPEQPMACTPPATLSGE